MKKMIKSLVLTGALALAAVGGFAAPASAIPSCTGGAACSHQTGILFNGDEFGVGYEWHSSYTLLKMNANGELSLSCANDGSSQQVWSTNVSNSLGSPWVLFEGPNNGGGGSMVIYQGSWVTGTDGNAFLEYNPAWTSLTKPPTHATRGVEAVVQADGNFVIYDSNNTPLWSSNTYHVCPGTAGYQN